MISEDQTLKTNERCGLFIVEKLYQSASKLKKQPIEKFTSGLPAIRFNGTLLSKTVLFNTRSLPLSF